MTIHNSTLESKFKVMGRVKSQCHIEDPISRRCISVWFHAGGIIDSWDTKISRLKLKNQGQYHEQGQKLRSCSGPNILSIRIPFAPCQSDHPFLTSGEFKILFWKPMVRSWVRSKAKAICRHCETGCFLNIYWKERSRTGQPTFWI